LFGLRLDKRAFEADFGVSVEAGLPREHTFMRAMAAYATNTADEITLTERGRYLLVAMMREFFVGVNGIRDQARANLPQAERDLFFSGGELECPPDGAASAVAETENAEHSPVP
jgi:hypothetical protein